VLKNPELAAVLRAIAANGSSALLEGEVAQAIVDKVRNHPTNPGKLSLSDLASYQPRKRTPICHDYKANGRDFRICGFPPPSSGAIAVGQILGILSNTQAASAAAAGRCANTRWPRPVGRLALPVHRSRPAGLRRPRAVPGRPGLRAAATPATG
jgi:gamma-glutamyltranspeptidase/glutathione hydrolase